MVMILRGGATLECLQAGIEAALEHLYGAAEAGVDIGGRDMELCSRFTAGEALINTPIDNLAIDIGEQNHHFSQQAKQLFFLSQGFGVLARIFSLTFLLFREGNFPAAGGLAANISGGVGDNGVHPGTGLGTATAGPGGLQDLDPTELQGVLGQTVVAGNPLGEGEKALGAASDPCFRLTFEEGTSLSGLPELRGGKNVEIIGHGLHLSYNVRQSPPSHHNSSKSLSFAG